MKFIIEEEEEEIHEVILKATLVIHNNTLQLELTNTQTGYTNTILGISIDGTLCKYTLNPLWAKTAGIKIEDSDRYGDCIVER
ncbi:MAG: hypothetical protein U9Q97_08895 [Acidobacteriota bacterium]|nr:hypothetical protein [Acidobacteriota bacterium]